MRKTDVSQFFHYFFAEISMHQLMTKNRSWHARAHTHTHSYTYIYVIQCVCVCVYTYIYVYIYICIHTCIYNTHTGAGAVEHVQSLQALVRALHSQVTQVCVYTHTYIYIHIHT